MLSFGCVLSAAWKEICKTVPLGTWDLMTEGCVWLHVWPTTPTNTHIITESLQIENLLNSQTIFFPFSPGFPQEEVLPVVLPGYWPFWPMTCHLTLCLANALPSTTRLGPSWPITSPLNMALSQWKAPGAFCSSELTDGRTDRDRDLERGCEGLGLHSQTLLRHLHWCGWIVLS